MMFEKKQETKRFFVNRKNTREEIYHKAWLGGVEAADRNLKEEITRAMDSMDAVSFLEWMKGFVKL